MTERYDFITENATEEACVNRVELLWFHCFNRAGAVADWQRACDEVSAAVDAKRVPSGYILAYGSFNDYAYKEIFRLLAKSRRSSVYEVGYAIKELRAAAAKARAKVS